MKDEKDTSVIDLNPEKGKGKDKNPVMYIGINKLPYKVKIVATSENNIFHSEQNNGSIKNS